MVKTSNFKVYSNSGEKFDTTSTSMVFLEISTKNVFDPDSKIQAPNVRGSVGMVFDERSTSGRDLRETR